MEDNINSKENFVVTRYKNASEISWLKDIHIALVDKYYHDITDSDIVVGDAITNSLGQEVGEIIDLVDIRDENDEEEIVQTFGLVHLDQYVNFDVLIQLGVPVENIVFDKHDWNVNTDSPNSDTESYFEFRN